MKEIEDMNQEEKRALYSRLATELRHTDEIRKKDFFKAEDCNPYIVGDIYAPDVLKAAHLIADALTGNIHKCDTQRGKFRVKSYRRSQYVPKEIAPKYADICNELAGIFKRYAYEGERDAQKD